VSDESAEMGTLDWLCVAIDRLRTEVDNVEADGLVTLTPAAVRLVKVLAGEYVRALPEQADVTLDASAAVALVVVSEAGLASALRERKRRSAGDGVPS
jgi:hypothetical protein